MPWLCLVGTITTLILKHSQAFSSILKHSQVVSSGDSVQEACQRLLKCNKRAKFPYASLMPTIGGGVNLRHGGLLTLYAIIVVPDHIQNKPKLG